MVSNLQHYPYVTITNKTPYDTFEANDNWDHNHKHDGYRDLLDTWVDYSTHACSADNAGVIVSGDAWTASSRGACLVYRIHASLTVPDVRTKRGTSALTCASYASSGTSYSIFSIIMDGEDACCVLSSHEQPQECP